MKKYIECEAAYRFAQDQLKKETGAYSKGWNNALGVMKGALHNNDAITAADVVPVVRGEWIVCGDGDNVPYMCSHCGKTTPAVLIQHYPRNYCPNCGARMD